MPGIRVPEEFCERAAALYGELHSAPKVAERMGVSEKTVRRYLDIAGVARTGHLAVPQDIPPGEHIRLDEHPERIHQRVDTGYAIIGSDGHYWPGPASTAHRGLVHLVKELQPKAVICNGDALDAATISRHPPIGWETRPNLIQELTASRERMTEIEDAAPRRCTLSWNLGNHDGRFETRLATVAPEFARIHGMHLKDHFQAWEPAWATWINGEVVVKHRFKGGTHAAYNNAVASGKTMVTGHLHSARVSPYTDYNGTRYGVDAGCLADPEARAFTDYTEDNPRDWRSAFAVLKFHKGRLMQPELALVWDKTHIEFRGQLIRV